MQKGEYAAEGGVLPDQAWARCAPAPRRATWTLCAVRWPRGALLQCRRISRRPRPAMTGASAGGLCRSARSATRR